jgi:hypothetical protein
MSPSRAREHPSGRDQKPDKEAPSTNASHSSSQLVHSSNSNSNNTSASSTTNSSSNNISTSTKNHNNNNSNNSNAPKTIVSDVPEKKATVKKSAGTGTRGQAAQKEKVVVTDVGKSDQPERKEQHQQPQQRGDLSVKSTKKEKTKQKVEDMSLSRILDDV